MSKFSKVSLFSGLNNLQDLTLDPRYSAICGYTEADLDAVFAPELPGPRPQAPSASGTTATPGAGEEKVYNPFDILLLLRNREFRAWWFETGTPAFLVETLFRRRIASVSLDGMLGSNDLLSTFDVDDIATEALLFQTGYLTIASEEDLGGNLLYRLGYPNREVRQSLNESLLRYLVKDATRQTANQVHLYRRLETNDFAGIEELFRAFFASIPYEWYTNNDIARYEGYYASVFYSYFAALGLDVTVEDSTSHGRLDMAVEFNDNVYLFEFKVVELAGEGAAMAQLRSRGYADKYRHLGRPIHLVAVEFSKETRNSGRVRDGASIARAARAGALGVMPVLPGITSQATGKPSRVTIRATAMRLYAACGVRRSNAPVVSHSNLSAACPSAARTRSPRGGPGRPPSHDGGSGILRRRRVRIVG